MVFIELNRFWNQYGWQIMIAFAIISLLYVAIFENNSQGTYSTEMPELNFKKLLDLRNIVKVKQNVEMYCKII